MLSEAILSLFCRQEKVGALNPSQDEWTVTTALAKADSVFPHFRQHIQGKVVLDYGSGFGYQCIAMAKAGAVRVVGLDAMEEAVQAGKSLAADNGVSDQVSFVRSPQELQAKVDVVLCQNSFEHFPDPQDELITMASLLAPGGKLLICFGPPWNSPWGAHMAYFCRLPWVQVLFPERAVMNVRARYRDDGARRYVDVLGGLNMMSLAKWEGLVAASGLSVEYSRYRAIKDIDALAQVPGLREFMVNDVAVILVNPAL